MLAPDVLARLAALDTAALCDADRDLRVMARDLRPMTSFRLMVGPARTVYCRDDFLTVLQALHDSGPGEVLVIDGGGGALALAGELFATEAARRGLAGLVIDGACRDSARLATLALPVYARWVCPAAGTAQRLAETQGEVVCGGVIVGPGDVVVGDRDGVVVVSESDLPELLPRAEEVQRTEAAVMERVERGECLLDLLNFAEHRDAVRQGKPSRLQFRP
jgi:RraA family protein